MPSTTSTPPPAGSLRSRALLPASAISTMRSRTVIRAVLEQNEASARGAQQSRACCIVTMATATKRSSSFSARFRSSRGIREGAQQPRRDAGCRPGSFERRRRQRSSGCRACRSDARNVESLVNLALVDRCSGRPQGGRARPVCAQRRRDRSRATRGRTTQPCRRGRRGRRYVAVAIEHYRAFLQIRHRHARRAGPASPGPPHRPRRQLEFGIEN